MSWVSTTRGRRWKGDDGRLYASADAELKTKQKAPGSTLIEQMTGTRFVEPLARALDPSRLVSAVGSGFNQLARSAQAAVDPAEAYRQDWEKQNQIALSQKALLDRVGPHIVTGLDEDGNVDRTKSDLYKQYAPKPFPMTPSGQFERYFKTPEMDQYFGTASRGAGAPKDVEAMKALAARTTAPGTTPQDLASFYRAESAMGRAQMPQIQESLGYAKGSDMAKWAEANPMLAQRLYAKQQAGAEAVKQSAIAQTTPGSQYGGGVFPGAFGTTAPTLGSEDFAVAANAVPAPWNTQGAKVSDDFAAVVPFQAAKTTGEGMPAFQTTLDKAEDFLARTKAGSSFADPNMAKTWGAWGRILN